MIDAYSFTIYCTNVLIKMHHIGIYTWYTILQKLTKHHDIHANDSNAKKKKYFSILAQ